LIQLFVLRMGLPLGADFQKRTIKIQNDRTLLDEEKNSKVVQTDHSSKLIS